MHLTLTTRMAWIAAICLAALLGLMFVIGLLIGRAWAPTLPGTPRQSLPVAARQATPTVPDAPQAGAGELPLPSTDRANKR